MIDLGGALKEDRDPDPNEPIGGWEDPVIRYLVDLGQIVRLIDLVNEEKVYIGTVDCLKEWLSYGDEESNLKPGIYMSRVTLQSHLSGPPDSQDWDTDIKFHETQKSVSYNWEECGGGKKWAVGKQG